METQEQQPIKNKTNKKLWVLAILLFAFFIAIGTYFDLGSSTPTQTSSSKKTQAPIVKTDLEEVRKNQKEAVDNLYFVSKKMLEESVGLMTAMKKDNKIARSAGFYSIFKDGEEKYKNLSVKLVGLKSLADEDYMKEYKDDTNRILDALANASVIQQICFKNIADYINTGNLESQRKANEEIDKNPSEIIMRATNEIIVMAGKIGMDSDAMKKEVGEILKEAQK